MKSICFTHSIVDEENNTQEFLGLDFKANLDFEDFKQIVKILQHSYDFSKDVIIAQMKYRTNSKYTVEEFSEQDHNASKANMWYDVTETVISDSKHYTNTVVHDGEYETSIYTVMEMPDGEYMFYINTSIGEDISSNQELHIIDINDLYGQENYDDLFEYMVDNFGDINESDVENFVNNQIEQLQSIDLGMQQGGDDLEV